MPDNQLRAHLRNETELHLPQPRDIPRYELRPRLARLSSNQPDMMWRFFRLRRNIERRGDEQIKIHVLHRCREEIAMQVDHGGGDALLSELQSLAQLQEFVPQEDEHESPVGIGPLFEGFGVLFFEFVLEFEEFFGGECPVFALGRDPVVGCHFSVAESTKKDQRPVCLICSLSEVTAEPRRGPFHSHLRTLDCAFPALKDRNRVPDQRNRTLGRGRVIDISVDDYRRLRKKREKI